LTQPSDQPLQNLFAWQHDPISEESAMGSSEQSRRPNIGRPHDAIQPPLDPRLDDRVG
jgi:hypothetical protein